MKRLSCRTLSLAVITIIATIPLQAQQVDQLDPATRKVMDSAAAQGFPLRVSFGNSLASVQGNPGPGQSPGASSSTTQPTPNPAPARKPTQPADQSKDQQAGGSKSSPVSAPSAPGNVIDNVQVEAVLLPASVSRKVFGKEIGNNYAAVELTVSNHSTIASFIVDTIFIDYSDWALSGSAYLQSLRVGGSPASSPRLPSQARTNPNQIASVEYRAVRGELRPTCDQVKPAST